MNWRVVMASLLGLFWLWAAAGCGGGGRKELVVGMELKYPPFEMTDPSGAPAGVSPEIAAELARFMGRPLRIENMPFDGLIPALKTGKIDLILSSMTATEERARSIDFSQPYLRTGLALLVSADAADVGGIADLDRPGRKVAVKRGTTGHLYAQEHLKSAALLVLAEETACVLEVVQGKADAFIYDQMSVYQNWSKNRGRVRALLRPFREEAWAVGVRKGEDGLRRSVDAFLADFRGRGGFERLGDKYLAEEKRAFAELGCPFFF